MLFDTVAEYDAEIAEVRPLLKKSMTEQAYTSGGSGRDMQVRRGDVQSIRDYLQLLSKERDILLNRQGGRVTLAEFGRES